jgi:RNA polymerase sigma-70 factor (ECF subfamily)
VTPTLVEELYRTHRGHALKRLGRLLRDPGWAEDVVQECFARLLEPHAAFAGRAELRHWIERILTHRALSELRRRPVRPDPPDAEGDSVELRLELAEELGRVREALATLPERDRLLIGLHHFEELGYPAIAERLRLPEGTVKSGLSRARARLARALLTAPPRALTPPGRGPLRAHRGGS